MKWVVCIIHPDSSVEKTTFDNKPEAEALYSKTVTLAREKGEPLRIVLQSVGQVLQFRKKEK